MTRQEIEETGEMARSTNGWLREVALQLATLNEAIPIRAEIVSYRDHVTIPPVKRGPGRPPKNPQ